MLIWIILWIEHNRYTHLAGKSVKRIKTLSLPFYIYIYFHTNTYIKIYNLSNFSVFYGVQQIPSSWTQSVWRQAVPSKGLLYYIIVWKSGIDQINAVLNLIWNTLLTNSRYFWSFNIFAVCTFVKTSSPSFMFFYQRGEICIREIPINWCCI